MRERQRFRGFIKGGLRKCARILRKFRENTVVSYPTARASKAHRPTATLPYGTRGEAHAVARYLPRATQGILSDARAIASASVG